MCFVFLDSSLVTTALFDREVNCRRAASVSKILLLCSKTVLTVFSRYTFNTSICGSTTVKKSSNLGTARKSVFTYLMTTWIEGRGRKVRCFDLSVFAPKRIVVVLKLKGKLITHNYCYLFIVTCSKLQAFNTACK